MPIAAQGLNPLGGGGVAVVEGFLQSFVVGALVGLADVGELFEVHLLGVFRRGHPGIDPKLFELFQHRLDPSRGGIAVQDHFQLAALGIEVGVRPGAIADPGAVLEGDGVLVPVLHAGVVIEQRPVVDVVGLDGNGAGTDPALGVGHLAAFHLERRFLLGFLRVELGQVLLEYAVGGPVPVDGLFDLLDPFQIVVRHLLDLGVGALLQGFQFLAQAQGLVDLGPVVLAVAHVEIDVFDGVQNRRKEAVFDQRLSLFPGRRLHIPAQHLVDAAVGVRPDLHLDHGALLPLEALGEDQRVLVLHVAAVEGQRLALPAEFAGLLDQGLFGGGEQLFLAGGGTQLVETKAPIPQHVGVIALEVPPEIVFPLQGQIVEMPQPGRVLGEPSLGVGPQQIEVILVGDLFDFLDVAQGRVRIDPYLPFLGRPEDLVVKRLFLAADAVGVIVERELVLAQKLEGLAFVDAVDATVPGADELLGVSVVVGDQPVDHMLALDLLQFDGGQILGQDVAKIEVVPQIGAPFLDGAGAAV